MSDTARRAFSTTLDDPDEPQWAPLEAVARLSRDREDLASFHEYEFMYMTSVYSARKKLRIHLHNHRDTRRYLNLDDAGHAYEYCGSADEAIEISGGRYRLHASLVDALEGADLWIFAVHPSFIRSFPPELWPSEDVGWRTAPSMLGRVIALQSVVMIGTTPISGPLLDELSDAAGGRAPMLVGGVVALVAAGLGALAGRHARVAAVVGAH